MSLPTNDKEKAHWNGIETEALIDYLYVHQSEGGDGGSFKPVTFNAAAVHIGPHLTQGPTKTEKMCRTKWILVCLLLNLITHLHNID